MQAYRNPPPPPVGCPNICAIQASGVIVLTKYVFNAQAIFWDFLIS